MLAEGRKLMAQNMPLPPDVQKAIKSYERDKARNRVYLRKRRASEKVDIPMHDMATPSGGSHPFDTASIDTLPSQFFNAASVDQSQRDRMQESTGSPASSRAEKAVDCTGLNSVDNHQHRSFADKAVSNEF